MNLNRFESGRRDRWSQLEVMVAQAGSRPEKLGVDAVRTMARLYRATAADLAYARLHYPGTPVVGRLEALVTAARFVVYDRPARRQSILYFFSTGYWKHLYDRRQLLALAAAALLIPALFGLIYGMQSPEQALARLPEGFRWIQTAESTDQGLDFLGLAGFSVFILTNNIIVTLLTFAYGITFGLGTIWILVQNGFILGEVSGIAIEAGNWQLLVAATAGHGTLELSAIVIGGATGLGLGRAMIRPGQLTRRQSLAAEGVAATQIFAGTALLLAFLGFVEGFLSRTGLPWFPVLVVGVLFFIIFWGLVAWRGNLGGTPTSVPFTDERPLLRVDSSLRTPH